MIYLSLGDTLRESLSMSPMDLDVGADLILGWDWISSHDLGHLYAAGRVNLRSGPALLQLDLLPAGNRPAANSLPVIAHGEFRRLLRQIERAAPVPADTPTTTSTAALPQGPPRGCTGWSRPLNADHAELAAAAASGFCAPTTGTRRPPTGPDSTGPRAGPIPIHGGVPGAAGPLGRCALVYMDDCLVHSPTLAQHLLDVAEVLEIFRRRQFYAKSSKC